MPDRCRVEDLFDWEAVAKETKMSPEALLDATFGPGPRRAGLLRTRRGTAQWPLTEEGRRQLGVLVIPDFVQGMKKPRFWVISSILKLEQGFPGKNEKVDKSKAFTELPSALDSIRSRLQRLLRFDDFDADTVNDAGVAESLRRYAMSAATRGGRQGALSQAFVQRYELDGDEMTSNRKQALGMHFDSRNANAEVVIGLSLGEDQGHIFFSRSGPHKGQPFPLSLALEERGDGILVELPRRALYMFYGFARYHLRHGVPWHHDAARGGYRRVTVTLRSVPRPMPAAPAAKRRRKDGEDAKQRRLMEMLQSFAQPLEKAAPLIDLTD